jgi:BirA family transcriptional regulator, biotin operon repressor / biotin---[acetyl-CoA-carboxylase] ligase
MSHKIFRIPDKIGKIGNQLYFFLSLPSTNDEALRMARNNANHGTIIVSKIQTKGRGRGSNIWFSEPGGLYLSIILRPNLNYEQSLPLALVVGLSVAQAIESIADLKVTTRWVNDLMIDNKKVGGILLETESETDSPAFFIAGIGVNVNQTSFPTDESITSLRLKTNNKFSRWEIIKAIVKELGKNYQLFLKQRFSALREEYKSRCSILNQTITLVVGAEKFKGKAIDIDEDGKLVLLTIQNEIRKFQTGHILP